MWSIVTTISPIGKLIHSGILLCLIVVAVMIFVIHGACDKWKSGDSDPAAFNFAIFVAVCTALALGRFLWPWIAPLFHSHKALEAAGGGKTRRRRSRRAAPSSSSSSSSSGSGSPQTVRGAASSAVANTIQNVANDQDVQQGVTNKVKSVMRHRGWLKEAEDTAVAGGEDAAEVAA
jgi:hypothetical protein